MFFFFFFFFFSSRRRHTRSVSAFLLNRSSDLALSGSRSGWLWPVDAKGEPLKATSYMAVGFYVAKYVNKKSDMDLAAKIGRASCRERVWFSVFGGSVGEKSWCVVI